MAEREKPLGPWSGPGRQKKRVAVLAFVPFVFFVVSRLEGSIVAAKSPLPQEWIQAPAHFCGRREFAPTPSSEKVAGPRVKPGTMSENGFPFFVPFVFFVVSRLEGSIVAAKSPLLQEWIQAPAHFCGRREFAPTGLETIADRSPLP